jgi:hypothetical protein
MKDMRIDLSSNIGVVSMRCICFARFSKGDLRDMYISFNSNRIQMSKGMKCMIVGFSPKS